MCQRASGKRSSGKKLTLPLRYLRSVDGSVELRFCPVMGKLPTDETSASEDSSSETCPSSASLHTHDEKQHSCFICSHFQSNLKEEEEAFFPKLHFSSTLPALIKYYCNDFLICLALFQNVSFPTVCCAVPLSQLTWSSWRLRLFSQCYIILSVSRASLSFNSAPIRRCGHSFIWPLLARYSAPRCG